MYFPAVRSCAFSKVTARRVPGAVRRAQRGAEDRQVAVRGAQRGGEDRQVADHVTESATTLALATQSATTLADATQSKTSSDTQSTAKTRPARRLGPTSSDHRAVGAMPPPSSRPRGEGGLRGGGSNSGSLSSDWPQRSTPRGPTPPARAGGLRGSGGGARGVPRRAARPVLPAGGGPPPCPYPHSASAG